MSDRTVTELSAYARAAGGGHAVLGVVLVHSRGPIEPRAYELKPNGVTVGREGDIAVDDLGASRAHARLEQRESVVWVTDLKSRNGTYVNGELVPPPGRPAAPGSVIRTGQSLLVVVADVSPYSTLRPRPLPGLLGGAQLDDARMCIETIATTPSPILILGETGTGKEVVAGLLHRESGRTGDLVALNCAAVPAELVDAELFGHTRGAFSGAQSARTGLFRAADGGTLFLDEIGEMPPAVQAKLLRTLETNEVRAVGEDRPTKVDVRVVAATNREVDQLVETGAFRGDLLHRLAGLRIVLPPLRERVEDVPTLAEHFIAGSGMGFAVTALERLVLYAWPGNVRELRNMVSAGLEIGRRKGHDKIELGDLPGFSGSSPPKSRPSAGEEELMVIRVSEALSRAAGDVAAAARELGMSRSALYEALRRLRIDPRGYRRR